MQALELTLAARYEEYNDFGEDVTPKLGVRWAPIQGLSLRATYGESFKAPTVAELAPGTESLLAFFASDFGVTLPGDPLVLLRAQAAQPELQEETSKSWTAGFDWQPADSALSVSATWFRIEFDNRIDVPFAGGFEEFFNSPDVFGDFLVFDPGAAFVEAQLARATDFADLTGGAFSPDAVGIWADVAVTNVAAEDQSGIDLLLRYPVQTSWGSIDAGVNGTYLLQYEKRVAPRAPARDLLNLLNEPIDLRLRANLAVTRGPASAALFVNYQDDYQTTRLEPIRIGSWTTVDLQLRYEIDPHGSAGPFGGVELALSIQNLFDRDPPFVATQGSPIAHSGYDAVNATPLGRFVAVEVSKSW